MNRSAAIKKTTFGAPSHQDAADTASVEMFAYHLQERENEHSEGDANFRRIRKRASLQGLLWGPLFGKPKSLKLSSAVG